MMLICNDCGLIFSEDELAYWKEDRGEDELDELIKKKTELAAAKKQYDEIDKQIKAKVGEREKVITSEYLIERKPRQIQEYVVKARTDYHLSIKRL